MQLTKLFKKSPLTPAQLLTTLANATRVPPPPTPSSPSSPTPTPTPPYPHLNLLTTADGIWACCCGFETPLANHSGPFPFAHLRCGSCAHILCGACRTSAVVARVAPGEKVAMRVCPGCGLSHRGKVRACVCGERRGETWVGYVFGETAEYRADPVRIAHECRMGVLEGKMERAQVEREEAARKAREGGVVEMQSIPVLTPPTPTLRVDHPPPKRSGPWDGVEKLPYCLIATPWIEQDPLLQSRLHTPPRTGTWTTADHHQQTHTNAETVLVYKAVQGSVVGESLSERGSEKVHGELVSPQAASPPAERARVFEDQTPTEYCAQGCVECSQELGWPDADAAAPAVRETDEQPIECLDEDLNEECLDEDLNEECLDEEFLDEDVLDEEVLDEEVLDEEFRDEEFQDEEFRDEEVLDEAVLNKDEPDQNATPALFPVAAEAYPELPATWEFYKTHITQKKRAHPTANTASPPVQETANQPTDCLDEDGLDGDVAPALVSVDAQAHPELPAMWEFYKMHISQNCG
ncbi:hypothetical protein EJ07DRAFT_157073 [Lizonia empirigonia]|nr:hypothetical protein EJ07DRAFT_157073 [Lizonia empirigonia]